MEKPMILEQEELKSKLVNDINESNLPVWIIKLILDKIYTDINILSTECYAKSLSEYTQSINESVDNIE